MIIGDRNINGNCNSDKVFNDTKFFDVFGLLKFICTNTCSKSSNYRSVDAIFKKRPRSFHKTSTITRGFSDFPVDAQC